MAITIYKSVSHVDWDALGVGVTTSLGGGGGGGTPLPADIITGSGISPQVAVFSTGQRITGFDGFTYEEDSAGIGLLRVSNIKAGNLFDAYGTGENLTLQAADGDSIGGGGSLFLSPGIGGGGSGLIYFGNANYDDWILYVQTEGIQSNINLNISSKGSGSATLLSPSGYSTLQGIGIYLAAPDIMAGGFADSILYGSSGILAHQTGYNLTIKGGRGYSVGINDGGDLYLYGGDQYGGGVVGKVFIGTGSGGSNPLAGSGTGTSILLYNRSTGEITYGDK
jgi:hypothetical protein